MKLHRFRASAISKIMTDPKGKDEVLSAGAKTEIERIAKEIVYGYSESFSSKYTDKGIQVERQSIDLYNSVFFTDYVKNEERRSNEWVTGECDIFTGTKVIDVKSSWSLATFPATAAAGADKAYEWQARVYMWLWEVEDYEVAYCMVSTPPDLIGYENEELHDVEHINPELRVTIVRYKRDRALEEKIRQKVEAATEYLDAIIQQIHEEHQG